MSMATAAGRAARAWSSFLPSVASSQGLTVGTPAPPSSPTRSQASSMIAASSPSPVQASVPSPAAAERTQRLYETVS